MSKKMPKNFEYLLWSYDFSRINPDKDKERIIINTLNYGDWEHWQWIIDNYGKKKIKEFIENTPKSEFRKRALKLISLILGIKEVKYVSQGAKIRAKRNIS